MSQVVRPENPTAAAQERFLRETAGHPRNPGMPLDLQAVRGVRVNRAAADHRAATLTKRRSVKREWQAGWLLRAVTMIDLTTLAGDDTPGRVRRLCGKARRPVREDILDALDVPPSEVTVAAVCVYHGLVGAARQALRGTGIPVAAVSTGFPAGLSPLGARVLEIRESVAAGAAEIDVVITRGKVLAGDWERLYDEVAAFREACGDAHIKVILGTGELGTLANVKRAALVAMMAGADFVKTSTGKEAVNATLPVGIVLARAIREYCRATGNTRGAEGRRRAGHGQGRDRVADPGQGGTRRRLDAAEPLPHRRQLPPRRYRASARAPCHGEVLGLPPPRSGLARGLLKNDPSPQGVPGDQLRTRP